MGEGVDPHRAVGALHNHGLARAVLDALKRIGKRGADEPRGICEHVIHGAAGEFLGIERQHNARQQDAIALTFDYAAGCFGGDAASLGDAFGVFGDERGTDLGAIRC